MPSLTLTTAPLRSAFGKLNEYCLPRQVKLALSRWLPGVTVNTPRPAWVVWIVPTC